MLNDVLWQIHSCSSSSNSNSVCVSNYFLYDISSVSLCCLQGTPALFLTELLLTPSMLKEGVSQEKYVVFRIHYLELYFAPHHSQSFFYKYHKMWSWNPKGSGLGIVNILTVLLLPFTNQHLKKIKRLYLTQLFLFHV